MDLSSDSEEPSSSKDSRTGTVTGGTGASQRGFAENGENACYHDPRRGEKYDTPP